MLLQLRINKNTKTQLEEKLNTTSQSHGLETISPQIRLKLFDDLVGTGNAAAIQLGVDALKSAYETANGYEGRMLTGKAAETKGDVFRSQAQLVKAMSDPRYDNDPAYRQDVIAKLERSDIDF